MTDEQRMLRTAAHRLLACEVLLRDSLYKSPGIEFAHDVVKAELGRLESKLATEIEGEIADGD